MILTIPVPYEAYVTLPGKRLVEPVHLVASIPVKVEEVALEAPVATWSRDGMVRRYYDVEGRLLAPWFVSYELDRLRAYQAVPLDLVERLLPGAAAWHNIRGRPVVEGQPKGPMAWEYLTLVTNPFTPRRLAHDLHTFGVKSVLPEDGVFRMSREARLDCREEAIEYARAAASRMAVRVGIHGRHLLVPTSGPCWEVSSERRYRDSITARPDAMDGRPWSSLHLSWTDTYGADGFAAATATLVDAEGRNTLPLQNGHIEIHREGYPWIDRSMRLAARAREVCCIGRNHVRFETGAKLIGSSTSAAMAWFRLRDLADALPIEAAADGEMWEAAADLVRQEGVGANRLRPLFPSADTQSLQAA